MALGRKLIKKITGITVKPVLAHYLQKPRNYCFRGFVIRIEPGVFHPGFFFSTRYLLGYLETLHLKELKIAEAGCGSGLISMVLARAGNEVTAFDINPVAIHALEENIQHNRHLLGENKLHIYLSDLFNDMPETTYDVIIVNPPYFRKNPDKIADHAWYAGQNLEYFSRLFTATKERMTSASKLYMVLSQDCDITSICDIGKTAGYSCTKVHRKKFPGEWNYLFLFRKMRA